MKKVVVTDQAFGQTEAEESMARAEGAAFAAWQLSDEGETANAVRGAAVVLNNFAPMTRRVLAELPTGATVIRYGVGVDNIDLEAARDLGLRVCNVPDYGIDEVADHATAMALALSRKLTRFDSGIRAGQWDITQIVGILPSLREKTVGLIGFGRIAQSFAQRMQAFGCEVVASDPFVDPAQAQAAGVTLTTQDAVIVRADILSLHIPLTPKTHHIIGAAELAALPAQAIIINAARGGLIDETALAEALHQGTLAGAGLDVFEREPLADNSPLRDAPNLFLSPHAAFYSDRSVRRLQRLAAEEAARALRGEALRCPLV